MNLSQKVARLPVEGRPGVIGRYDLTPRHLRCGVNSGRYSAYSDDDLWSMIKRGQE